LTNVPFLKMLPEMSLSNHKGKVYKLSELEVHMNILDEIKKLLKVEKDEEVVSAIQKFFKDAVGSEAEMKKKNEVIQTFETKIKELEEKIKELEEKSPGNSGEKKEELETVKSQLKELTTSNKKMVEVLHAMKKEKIIGLALREAKIMPADADKWKKFFDANPGLVEEQIKVLPVLIELKEKGSYQPAKEKELSEDDKKVAGALGLSEKDYKENLELEEEE